ncbi:hypothetical protein [Methylocella sp. CPCC 101449]|uniref:hypothetical protein n=1 Tax=Methylocella sp. CPCC 101449 TaxID=2987531 RepID=UPI00288E8FBD|nr:hypothetical protein [Methylocella sp. CPCC 101449]MDT2022838.1 hypothetical protein [Methylocella sp. CPCC 101449]
MTRRYEPSEADIYDGRRWIGRVCTKADGSAEAYVVEPDGETLRYVAKAQTTQEAAKIVRTAAAKPEAVKRAS